MPDLNQFRKTKRREVTAQDLEDALATVFLAPKGDVRSENREPSKAELERKQRLDRKRR